MIYDPAITDEDLKQDYAILRHTQGKCVAQCTFVSRRTIDAARRYWRGRKAGRRRLTGGDLNPVSTLLSEERSQVIQTALRRATPRQQKVAKLLMDGLQACQIAKRLHITRSAVTQILHRLRPLLLHAK